VNLALLVSCLELQQNNDVSDYESGEGSGRRQVDVEDVKGTKRRDAREEVQQHVQLPDQGGQKTKMCQITFLLNYDCQKFQEY
jgi:hypothetical protein